MKVEAITDGAWGAYCEKHPDAGFFHHPEWRTIQGAALHRFGVSDGKGDLLAVFQLYRSKRSGFTLWSNPPFNQHCGFLAVLKAKNPAKRIGEEKKIHAAIVAFLNTLDGVVTVAFPPEVADMQPYIWGHCKVIPNYTYRIALAPGMEAVCEAYAAETRNSIKKAVNDGVQVRKATSSEVLPLIEATFHRKDKALDHSKVKQVLEAFGKDDSGYAWLTEWNSKPVAAAFCALDAHSAYYLLGGHVKEGGHAGAGALTVDACIREAAARGIPQFDLEGSMIPEVERFFRGFGAVLTPFYTVNRASFLMEVLLKRNWRHLF